MSKEKMITAEDMIARLGLNDKKKNSFLYIVMRIFWRGLLAKFTLVGTLEVICQSLICYFENDWSLSNMWHVIAWSIWLAICIFVRIVCRKNYA